MENIVLIDYYLNCLDSLMKNEDLNIAVLVVANQNQKEKAERIYGTRIQDVVINTEKNFSPVEINYEEIEANSLSNIKSHMFYFRVYENINLINYYFLNALSYWLLKFKSSKIDAVIYYGFEHGEPVSSLALDIAKKNSLPVLIIDMELGTDLNTALSFKDYNKDSYISIHGFSSRLSKVTISDFEYVKELGVQVQNTGFLQEIKSAVLNSRYAHILLLALSFINKYRYIESFNIKYNRANIFLKWFKNMKAKRYYDKLAVFDSADENYIYYSMHFEPEASIMVRTQLNNQLFIIKMLSENLPEGWKLYVKEHPHQYALTSSGRLFYNTNLSHYKCKEFYNEIMMLKNVKLIDLKVDSKVLISSAKAVATINGTVSLETIRQSKPLILFGHRSSIFGLIKDVYKIEGTSSLRTAISDIKNEKLISYDDYQEVINSYSFQIPATTNLNLSTKDWQYIYSLLINS